VWRYAPFTVKICKYVVSLIVNSSVVKVCIKVDFLNTVCYNKPYNFRVYFNVCGQISEAVLQYKNF